jgi:phage terminase large subunit-like protein
VEDLLTYERYQPTEKQLAAHMSPMKYKLYGGAMGGGKSVWLCAEAIRLSLMYPGNEGLLARLSYKDLKRTTMQTLLEMIPQKIIKHYDKTFGVIEFSNGSRILLSDLEKPGKHKSLNLGWFGIDEATEASEDVFNMLKTRLRKKIEGIRYFGLLASNPEPGWVKDKFVSNPLSNSAYFQALPSDNPHLPEGYVQELINDLPQDWQASYINGFWDAFDSKIFKAMDIIPSEKDVEDIEFAFKVVTMDPAISEKDEEGGCETSITAMGVEYDTNLIHEIETISGHYTYNRAKDEFKAACKRHKPSFAGVEEVAFSKAYRQDLEQEGGLDCALVPIKADVDKVRRAASVSGFFERHLVRINDSKTQRQLIEFPKGTLKDRVDSIVYAIKLIKDYSSSSYEKKVDKYVNLDRRSKDFWKDHFNQQERQPGAFESFGL